MPRTRPATTGYERLAQADQFSDDSDTDPLDYSVASLQPASAPRYAAITQPRPHSGMTSPKMPGSSSRPPGGRKGNRGPRQRSNSGVDLKAINARLERWADEIASKFKRGKKKGGEEDEQLEIHHTVFQAPEGVRPVTAEMLARPEPGYMTKAEFEAIVDSVRTAIEQGVHPRMISQGSSGSYFARNTEGKVVGVFKPKDEEPYAAGNPKWNKWIHRNLFPCCFGRACLIPNLSYVSEAAAYVLDAQLRTHMVPYTDVVYLSSKSFHYPFWDRYTYSRSKKSLPAKPGSFQVFLKGFKDANLFLREHPWPDQYLSGFRTSDPQRKKKKRWVDSCRPGSSPAGEGDSDDENSSPISLTPGPDNFVWTPTLKQAFREELEKLVILDYIMRNTDRGLDNWMIKVDWETQEVSIVSEPVHLNTNTEEREEDDDAAEQGPRPVDLSQRGPPKTRASYPYRTQKPMDASTSTGAAIKDPKITIGAIDNSLSWPWKHPDAWRSFPFGWLFLPVDLIGRPFSQKTRDHFLPLLTSTAWWSQTQLALRRVFQLDPDFQERMFAKQIAVMKGQAWNVVETLKTPDHGPLELTRRAKVCVWDDLVDVPVAVPMRAPSAEMRRQAAATVAADREQHQGQTDYFTTGNRHKTTIDEEEMDIGFAGNSSKPAVADLLGLGSSNNTDLPHPGRFEIASPAAIYDDYPQSLPEGQISPPNGTTPTIDHPLASPPARRSESDNPTATRKHYPVSLRPPAANGLNMYNPERDGSAGPGATGQAGYHERRFSFATPASRKVGNTIASQMYSTSYSHNAHAREWSLEGAGEGMFGGYVNADGDMDELDDAGGDLGYAAAEGMEGNQRKVIVERLEAVKSRNPVFTWC
ncbi:phosphatidylinositol 3 and 4-kinase-domain-containing protein [Neurospora hispaniola]|uniref:Phosphatidylinositol 4-kinase n=1 Tax=Neurospora hispaniola TaxID=588809 RepID=A0AAJ0I337_9PEZI|nr:phosphatidylinositol 3 and 4-kinase-domain-containing protein [Neurospora hispaniola]